MKHKTTTQRKNRKPAPDRTIRGLLLLKGETLKDWATRTGHGYSLTRQAVLGLRNGPMSREIRKQLAEEVGL